MPGARVYYLMYGVVSRNFSLAAEHALVLLETCLGIAFGFIIVDVISRSIMRALGREYHMGKESTVIKKEKKIWLCYDDPDEFTGMKILRPYNIVRVKEKI